MNNTNLKDSCNNGLNAKTIHNKIDNNLSVENFSDINNPKPNNTTHKSFIEKPTPKRTFINKAQIL